MSNCVRWRLICVGRYYRACKVDLVFSGFLFSWRVVVGGSWVFLEVEVRWRLFGFGWRNWNWFW